MSYTKIIILALSLALVYACYLLAGKHPAEEAAVSKGQVVYENILTRASVRDFQDKAVSDAQIDSLLHAGMAAPTAADKRPWHFVVITDRQLLDQLAAINPHATFLKVAPLVIVVCGDMNKALEGEAREFWVQDASAASENILLAAHAMGLGAVWTGGYPSKDRCEAMARVLSLPDNLVPLNAIVIGYPAKDVQPKDKWDKSNVTYHTR